MKINTCNNRNSKIIYTKWKMKQKRVRNLPWRNGGTTIAGKTPRSGRRWPEVVDGGRRVWWQWVQRRDTARERDAKWRRLARLVVALAGGGRRWPELVDGGRRVSWQWVQRRERERATERVIERNAKWRALAREVVALAG